MDAAEDDWLGTKEAARLLGVVPRTLYRLIDDGDLPAYKIGRVIRLRRSDIAAFLERSRIAPGTLEHLYPGEDGRGGTDG